ncbi:MAG: Gfo/Idh/MocA family protein [Candidatus Poribacteria bacterium]
MLKVGFIGAGGRGQSAHYPSVVRLKDVSIEAVAELDESRMQTVVEKYKIPRAFKNYREMLETVDLDIVYCIMHERWVTPIAIDCMNAGKHIAIEKPPGMNSQETQKMLEAAIANNVYCMVTYQRRYSAVTQEALKLVRQRGPALFAMGEFHKPGNPDADAMDSLWNDVCHVADLVRYMIGSEVEEVTAYQDAQENGAKNVFNGLVRFANHAVGFISGVRCSGGRVLRSELHGRGVGCYMMHMPKQIEICEDGKPPRIVYGWELTGTDPNDEPTYEGVLAMHQHFVDCVRNKKIPCSDIRDVIKTSLLVDKLMGLA